MDERFTLIEQAEIDLYTAFSTKKLRTDLYALTDHLKRYDIIPTSFIEIGSRDGNDCKIISDYWGITPSNSYIIEAHPDCYDYIKYKHPEFQTFNFAASNITGTASFNAAILGVEFNIGASSLLLADKGLKSNPITINSYRMYDFMVNNSILSLDMLKIDVEGFGQQVLEGFGEKLRNISIVQIETEGSEIWVGQKLSSDVELYMKNMGFTIALKLDCWDVQYDCLFINNNINLI